MRYSLDTLEDGLQDLIKVISVLEVDDDTKEDLTDQVKQLLPSIYDADSEFDHLESELDDANDAIESLEQELSELESKPTDYYIPIMTIIDELKMRELKRLFNEKTLEQLEQLK